ncbi:hypothetical protein FRC02_011115 [Tulasnella sp. 418]|nr:hypothetical protein FRC02_011115 [Tulasnella sp. 418]
MTNDFMAYCNLIYLGMLSSRIPIVPPFVPELGHLAQGSLNTDFSEFFDLSRLRESLNYPVLEWSQVKKAAYAGSEFDLENVVEEPIGCWTNMKPFSDSHQVQQTNLPDFLKLDVSYTSTPRSAKLNEWNDAHTSFLGLSSIMYPTGRAKALSEKTSVPSYSPHQNLSLVPDDHLTCFDSLYFTAGRDTYEWEKDYSPVWTLVGKHMRFTKKVEDIAMFYLRKVFGVQRNEDIPPFISVHVRRSDFSWKKCLELSKKEECFLPLSAYATQIGHVQAELRSLNSPYPDGTHILVTSDEKDPNWWAQVRERGWYFIDHGGEKTSEVHGKWYPSIIDAYVQSQGIAFVGTGQSTMSLVAARRVQYWNNGPSRMVELN